MFVEEIKVGAPPPQYCNGHRRKKWKWGAAAALPDTAGYRNICGPVGGYTEVENTLSPRIEPGAGFLIHASAMPF